MIGMTAPNTHLLHYVLCEHHFLFTSFWFIPIFSGIQLGHKTGANSTTQISKFPWNYKHNSHNTVCMLLKCTFCYLTKCFLQSNFFKYKDFGITEYMHTHHRDPPSLKTTLQKINLFHHAYQVKRNFYTLLFPTTGKQEMSKRASEM